MYHNKKILLVDDEAGLLDMLKITLKKRAFYRYNLCLHCKRGLKFS